MKGNKAPKNIYLLLDDRNSNGLSICWYEAPYRTGAIGYTHTDAFIEKVVRFMKKIGDTEEYTWYNEEEHAAGITEKCIEDFKNYMKKE